MPGQGCELARKDCIGTSTPLLPKEQKPVHAHFPIISTVELETKDRKIFMISCDDRRKFV